MTMRLYGTKISPYYARIWLQAQLKRLPLTLVEGSAEDVIPEAMKRRNPIGKIPFLEDGDQMFFESEVICEYLEDRFPIPPLLPTDPFARSHARLLTRILDLYVLQPTHRLAPQIRAPQRDEALIARGFEDVARGLEHLASFLKPGPYAMGAKPSLADCALATGLWYFPRILVRLRPDYALPGEGPVGVYWRFICTAPVFAPSIDEMTEAHVAFRRELDKKLAAGR
ncbi:MAG: glutathione S-transferase family protein [Alphaproteobacteria bacterium]|nr:glutathione S-transferase family protein [Alphaproteobacteria bacterium]